MNRWGMWKKKLWEVGGFLYLFRPSRAPFGFSMGNTSKNQDERLTGDRTGLLID